MAPLWRGGIGHCTTQGVNGCGVVFKLTPNLDGTWTESVICSFGSDCGGYWPVAGLIFDAAGNLFGTTPYLGEGYVFELTPNSDGSWTGSVPHTFYIKSGGRPEAGLIMDANGNFYGTTREGGEFGYGVVFRLKPTSSGWNYAVIWHFRGTSGAYPMAALVLDAAGNLYGTTSGGGANGYGGVFKLTRTSTWWKYTVLRAFKGTSAYPNAGLVLDGAGNLYGTTTGDGTKTFGTVYEITP